MSYQDTVTTTDRRLVAAEMRVGDMVALLRSAVAGEPHWRSHAKALLSDIVCDACGGSGRNTHFASRPCSYCDGTGTARGCLE
jgi:hypothetical protein